MPLLSLLPCSTGREKQEVLQRGSSPLGLIPRAATGSEWSKPGKEGVGLSEILEDLDKQAGYVAGVCVCVIFW